MKKEEGQERARQAVYAAMALREWNPADLQRATGLDAGTVGDFLAGKRWPRSKTLAKIDRAFDWPAGSMMGMERGASPPPDEGVTQDELVVAEDPKADFERIDAMTHVSESQKEALRAMLSVMVWPEGRPDDGQGRVRRVAGS